MELNDEQLEISSSLFYAIPNPPEKQRAILNIDSSTTPDEHNKDDLYNSSKNLPKNAKIKRGTVSTKGKTHTRITKAVTLQLGEFLPGFEIIPIAERQKNKKKKSFSKKKNKTTNKLQSRTLDNIKNKNKKKQSKTHSTKKASKKQLKKQITTPLTNYIELQPIPNIKNGQELENAVLSSPLRKPVYSEKDPFPFTNLAEWLLWHENYPELALVREAYSPEDIPDNSKVYYINFAGQPIFYSSNWRILGSEIDITSTRQPPDHADWEIFSNLTDGLSLLLSDVWNITSQYSEGLTNEMVRRYPLVQFALKSLFILGYLSYKNSKWYSKGDLESLNKVTIELDTYMINQESISNYESLFIMGHDKDLLSKLITIDLVFSNSSFFATWTRAISKDQKILAVKKHKILLSGVISSLERLSYIEKLRTQQLLLKLK
ncbi:MAG: hypothetical protein ACTSW1_05775 [Candidatus Hodarchaeales archaeon]